MFTSVEGEGILYGTKTLFVRLAGCPFACFYCDTTEALPANSGTEYTIEEAASLIDKSIQKHTYKVNFTGGDPLMQHEAVADLARHVHLQHKGLLTYLESSCFDARRFGHVLPHMDVAKIEFKTSDSEFVDAPEQHQKMTQQALLCLEQAAASVDNTTYVKIVVSSKTGTNEIRDLAAAIFDVVKRPQKDVAGFVIQPVHGAGEPPLDLLLAMYDAVRPVYADVRVIPQLHKIIGAP